MTPSNPRPYSAVTAGDVEAKCDEIQKRYAAAIDAIECMPDDDKREWSNTVGALSRILATDDAPGAADFGIVTMQLIGVKNVSAADALARHGADLFIKEDSKRALGKEKISDKIFEIERRLLVRRRPT